MELPIMDQLSRSRAAAVDHFAYFVFALFGRSVASSFREQRWTVADRARQRAPVPPATLVRRFDAHAAASRPPVTVPWGSSGREGTTTTRSTGGQHGYD